MYDIIALSGKAQTGKTTAAKWISDLNPIYHVMSFADPIRQKLVEEFPDLVTMDDLRNHKKKVLDINGQRMTVRDLMIQFGRLYRAIDSDFWVKKLLASAEIHFHAGHGIVIDDMRYPNEVRLLTKMGARLIRVERPDIELIDDPSETLLDNHQFREYLHNNGSVDDYKRQICLLLAAKAAS